VGMGWRVVRQLHQGYVELAAVRRVLAKLGATARRAVVVVDTAVPAAHALPATLTHPGRVLLTTGMLDVLDDEERAAVVAHERAHLRHAHAVFRAVMEVAVALLPPLAPLREDLKLSLERWADEDAAGATDRAVMASALAKAGLATLGGTDPVGRAAWLHLHTHAVLYRVAALLDEPRRRARPVGAGHRRQPRRWGVLVGDP
jgi:beta-lactamase regulating signal transducer with metallopeptidase domain